MKRLTRNADADCMDDFGTCITCNEPDVELDQDRLCVTCAKESAQANGMDMGVEEE